MNEWERRPRCKIIQMFPQRKSCEQCKVQIWISFCVNTATAQHVGLSYDFVILPDYYQVCLKKWRCHGDMGPVGKVTVTGVSCWCEGQTTTNNHMTVSSCPWASRAAGRLCPALMHAGIFWWDKHLRWATELELTLHKHFPSGHHWKGPKNMNWHWNNGGYITMEEWAIPSVY